VLATVGLLAAAFAVAFWLPKRAWETAEAATSLGQPERSGSAVAKR
jgi:hypothetical protein